MSNDLIQNTKITREEISNWNFAFGYCYKYRYIRQKLLDLQNDKLEEIMSDMTKLQRDNIRIMTEIEIVVNTVQYCNDLMFMAICIKKKKINDIMKMFGSLGDNDCFVHFNIIKNADIKELKKYMGYDEIDITKSYEWKYNNSCEKFRRDIIKLSEFHKNFFDIYNSYKHGLRIIPIICENGKRLIFEACKDNTMTIHEIHELWYIGSIEIMEIINNIFEKLYAPLIRKKYAEFVNFNFSDKNIICSVSSTEPPDPMRPFSKEISFSIQPWYIHKGEEQIYFY